MSWKEIIITTSAFACLFLWLGFALNDGAEKQWGIELSRLEGQPSQSAK